MKNRYLLLFGIFLIGIFIFSFTCHSYIKENANANIQYLLVTDPSETDGRTVYTPECLADCHLVIKILINGTAAPSAISINSKTKNGFDWVLNKMNVEDDVNITDVRILKSEEYNETVLAESCGNPYELINGTNMDSCTMTEKIIIKTRKYFDSALNGFVVSKNAWTYIDIVGHRTPTYGIKYSTDVIPTIAGYQMTELAWWNSSYMNCMNFNITETSSKSVLNKPLEINFTGLFKQADNDDFRIVNASCNQVGNEQPYQIIDSTSNSVRAVFQINLTANLVANWSIYYNSSTATNPNYPYLMTFNDSFEGASLSDYWTPQDSDPSQIIETSTDYALYGSKSLKLGVSGAYYSRLFHAYANVVGTWEMNVRESGVTTSGVNAVPLDAETATPQIVRPAKRPATSTTKYSWGDYNSPYWYATGVSWVSTGAWWKATVVVNTSGGFVYIQNISVANKTVPTSVANFYINVDGGPAHNEYFDEYRFYQNVYDDPSQTYTISFGSSQLIPYPQYSNNSTNTTLAGAITEFRLSWLDTFNFTGGGFNFSWCNGTWSSEDRTNYNVTSDDNETDTTSFKTNMINTTIMHNLSLGLPLASAYWRSPAGATFVNFNTVGTQATAEQYTNMSTHNMVFASVQSDLTDDEPFWRFNFTIWENKTDINWLYLKQSGYENAGESGACRVLNFTNQALHAWGAVSPVSAGVNWTVNFTSYENDISKIINTTDNQVKFVVYGANFDPGDYVFVDYAEVQVNYNVTQKEVNLTYINYTGIDGEDYQNVDSVVAKIQIDSYDPSSSNSTFNNNNRPDIEVNFWNSTAWVNGFYCQINLTMGNNIKNTTDRNCTVSTTNSTITGAWKNQSNRMIQIRGVWLDINNSLIFDEINVTGVWGIVNGWNLTNNSGSCELDSASFINDAFVPFNSSVCNNTQTECWSNVSKLVTSVVSSFIKWKISANDSANFWNTSLIYNYTTTSSGFAAYFVNVSDSLAFIDINSRSVILNKNPLDYLSTSDSYARAGGFNKWIFDIMTISDRRNLSSIYYRRCSDSGNMIDSIYRSLSLSKTVYDNFVFYDSGRKTAVIFRSKADFMSFFDKARYVMIFSKNPSDLLVLSDARSRSLLFYRLPVEQMSIRDSSTDLLSLLRRSFDSVIVQDYDSRNVVFVRRSADSLVEMDKASYSRIVARSISDLISLLDYDSRNLNLYRTVIDSLTGQDTSLRTFYGIRRAGSSLLTGDSTKKLIGKTAYDSLILFDGEQRSLLLTRNSSDAVQFIDGLIRQSTFGRSMFDYFILYDNGRRTLVVSRLTQEQIQTLDKADKYYTVIKTAADRMTFSDFLTSQRTMARTTFSLLTLSDSKTRTAFLNRYGQSAIIINDHQARTSYLFRNISDFLIFADQHSRQKSSLVNKYDAFLVDDSVSRTLVINLEAAESVNIFEQLAGWILCFFGHTCTSTQTTTTIVESVPSGGGGGALVYKYIPILSNATQWLQFPEEINLTSKGGDYFLETITFLNFMPWEINLSVHFESFFMTDANTWAHQLDEDMKYSNETIHLRPGTPDKPSETLSNVEIHVPEQVWPYLYRFWIVSENINTQENRRTLVTIDTRDFDLLMKKINEALSVQYELANPIFGIKSIRLYDILAFIIFVSILVIGYYFIRKLYKQPVVHTKPAQQQPALLT